MVSKPSITLAAIVAASALFAGCSAKGHVRANVLKLRVDQGSFRMTKAVDGDGSISLAEPTQLMGSIEAGPILDAENSAATMVQVMLHEGCYYIIADGFRNLWQVTPRPGTALASYRPVSLPDITIKNARMSRYGPPGRACVRLDVDGGGPWYVSEKNRLQDECL